MKYDNINAFFWKTDLTKQRQEAIVEWVKSLPEDNRKMIQEMITDTQDQQHFNAIGW